MAVNTKEALLKELAQGSVAYEWGAILALGRDTVNAMLQEKFLERLAGLEFIPPISGEYYVDVHWTEQVAFDGLMFGPPSLSFEYASGKNSTVRVQMELIAGRCTSRSMFPGEQKYLRNSHQLSQGLGYWLEFTASLVSVPIDGEGGKQAQLALDLSQAKDPTCNLAPGAAERMGRFMLEQLLETQAFKQAFPFLTIAPTSSDVFSVVYVMPISQKAPNGVGTGSLPHTVGAVVLYMQLEGTQRPGLIPTAMPYLLPRKVDHIAENTGAALLIGRLRSQIGTERIAKLLSQIIFPGGPVIDITEEHFPHDMIGFGETRPSTSMALLSPGLSTIAAGQRVAFTSNNVKMYDWQARELRAPRLAGVISESGVYGARPIEEAGSAQRVTIVTAKVSPAADAATRAALVIESAEPLTISPRVITWYSNYAPIVLRASAASGLTWTLLPVNGETFGDIQYDPERPQEMTFTPTKQEQDTPFVRLQRIEVSDGTNTGHATVVLFGYGHRLDVEPFPVPRISPGASLEFKLKYPADKWELFGPGEIDSENGIYTAPTATNQEVSVVVGYVEGLAGAAVIEHLTPAPVQALSLAERWKSLLEFKLSRNNLYRNQVFANGIGQVGIDIVITTHSFTDEHDNVVYDPISDDELATLVLTDEIGSTIPYLTGEQLGIPEDSPYAWMASKRRHKQFDYYPVGQVDEMERAPGDDAGRRRVTVYVHSREAETARFRATFQDYRGLWHTSIDQGEETGEIQLEGMKLPERSLEYFRWPEMGKRVAQQGGSDYEGDRFNYWHSTTDYWELTGNSISFVDVAFESCSMLKWESEQVDETFASYIGVAFKPRRPEEASELVPGVNYQAELQLLCEEPAVNFKNLDYGFKGQDEVTTGAILVTLDRTSTLTFWNDYGDTQYRQVLQDAIKFTITDNYGNKHKLRLLFSGEQDARNYIELKFQ